MGRYIDADKLIKALHEKATYEALVGDMISYDAINSSIDKVKEQPTAYDPDKVVERLKKEKNPIYRADGSLMSDRSVIKIDKAIEIVKGGGVDGN